MATRAHLHDLTLKIRRYLARQKSEGVTAFVPASSEERAEFDARKKAQDEKQLAELRSQITSTSETPAPSKPAKKQPSSRRPVLMREGADPSGSATRVQAAPSVTADTPLWKKHEAIHELQARKEEKARRAMREKKSQAMAQPGPPPVGEEAPGASQPLAPPPENPQTPQEKMAFLRHYLGNCQRCPLHEGRTNIVFGSGDPGARLMFVGEGPGHHEDQQGLPFVGRSGQLLTKMIHAMGLTRDDVYITNIVKCRPPDNRNPAPLEVRECAPFLKKQIEVVEPEVIVTLGRPATNTLLGLEDEPLGKLRARWHEHRGIAVMPTYHPSYLLRTEPDVTFKKRAWEDLQKVMEKLGLS